MSRFEQEAIKHKIIPVIAIDKAEDAIPLGKVLKENGLPIAEIVLRTDAAYDAITLMKEHHPEIYLGAGTVKNAKQAIKAAVSGADFLVSPATNIMTIVQCADLEIELITGVCTPSDIESGLNVGLTTFKFFPAEAAGGVKMIKALLAPYTEVKLMPTGGITPDNIHDYLSIDRVLCCGGSWFIDKELINNGQWEELGKSIREAVALVGDK